MYIDVYVYIHRNTFEKHMSLTFLTFIYFLFF